MAAKVAKVSALALGLILALTACDPPMPPELLAEIAERTPACVDGQTAVVLPSALDGQIDTWAEALPALCPNMTVVAATKKILPEVVLSSVAPDAKICTPFASAPFAMDGAALVFFSSDFSNVNLDAKTAAAILNGEIKNWNDPAIASLNPDSTLPNKPISLDEKATQAQATALSDWFSRLSGAPVNLGKLKIDNTIGGQDRLNNLAEGAIAIADASDALAASAATVTIVTGKSLDTDVVSLDSTSLASASGQFKTTKTATSLGLTFDAKISPLTPKGSDTAVTPYQAVFPINMYLCGADNLKTRAFARFLLRQDTQGNIAGGSSLPLPDFLRIKAIEVVEKGLPKPSEAPAN